MILVKIVLCILTTSLSVITADELDFGLDYEVTDDFDYEVWNIGAKNLFIPYESMSYTSRRLITIPFETKRQISKIKAVIQPENVDYIQSMYLFRCIKSSVANLKTDANYEWFESRVVTNHDNEVHNCWKLMAVWTDADTVNKTILSLPNNMGIPINRQNDNEKYLLFEINYKNSDQIQEFADYSGFQVYVRKRNGEIDADILVVGSVPDYRLFIPPKMREWTVSGHCYKECLQNHLFVDGFNVLDVIHYSKSSLLKELIVEIKSDHNYDIDSKDEMSNEVMRWTHNQTSDEPIDLKLGETNQISTKCTFSSLNNSRTVLGGLSDESAQCMAWIVYYPKIDDFDVCLSSFTLTTIMSITGIDHLEEKWRNERQFDIVIKSWNTGQESERLEDYLRNKVNWDYRRVNRAKYVAREGRQSPQCSWKTSFFDQVMKR